MLWRTDTPTESPIVAYLEGCGIPEVLLLVHEPYPIYYDSAGDEVPTGMIQKWASLSETPTPSDLDEAAQGVKAHCIESSNPVSDSQNTELHCITLLYEEKENTPHILAGDELEIILRKK